MSALSWRTRRTAPGTDLPPWSMAMTSYASTGDVTPRVWRRGLQEQIHNRKRDGSEARSAGRGHTSFTSSKTASGDGALGFRTNSPGARAGGASGRPPGAPTPAAPLLLWERSEGNLWCPRGRDCFPESLPWKASPLPWDELSLPLHVLGPASGSAFSLKPREQTGSDTFQVGANKRVTTDTHLWLPI